MKIKLRKISFEGFKSPNRTASLIINNDICIMFADNGAGKTSLLKGLHCFLEQDENYLRALCVNKISCDYEVSDELKKTIKTIEVKYQKDKENYNWKEFEKSDLFLCKSLSIAIERGGSSTSFSHIDISDIEKFFDTKHTNANQLSHLQKPMKRQLAVDIYSYLARLNSKKSRDLKGLDQDFSQKHVYVENLETKDLEVLIRDEYKEACYDDIRRINGVLLTALNYAITKHNSIDKSNLTLNAHDLLSNRDRLLFALSQEEDNKTKSNLIKILENINTIPEAEKDIIGQPLLCLIFEKLINELNDESSVAARFHLLKDKFNSLLIENKKLYVDGSDICIKINEASHSLDELSSGERHMLTLLIATLFKCKGRNFLFIDEPEISLNIVWQEQLLSMLKKLSPNLQIIVASHSPFIVNGNRSCLGKLNIESKK